MQQKWKLLHSLMLAEMKDCLQLNISELEKVECTFRKAFNYWYELKKQIREYAFKDICEEIDFYKNIKPSFTGHIEYLTLVNHALLFVPKESNEIVEMFWRHEALRLLKFTDSNSEFIKYCKTGCTEHDRQYFLPTGYLSNFIISKPYNMSPELATSHDHLVSTLFGQEMYHEYVMKKLSDL